MTETQTCPLCERRLSEGRLDVFCPTCALRQALAAGEEFSKPGMTPEKARMLDVVSPEVLKSILGQSLNEPKPGDLIGDYEIIAKVGGNMGLIFKARHLLLRKVVALKLFPAEWILDDARRARFEREIRVMGQLAHPNLVTASDARSMESWRLVVMEWIDGRDLQCITHDKGPLSLPIACEVICQAARGLQYAHEHGLVHRDVKPSNLMVTSDGLVKVIDMGLAQAQEGSVAQVTNPGAVLGTLHYCAPEQMRDASTVDLRADIYGLGCSLYHLLTGKPPYWQRKMFVDVVQAHLNDPFPSLSKERSDVPRELEDVLRCMTAKNPAHRYRNMSAVVQALEPFAVDAQLSELVNLKTPKSLIPSSARASSTLRPAQLLVSNRWIKIAAFAGLIVLLCAVAVIFFQPTSRRDPVVVLMDTKAKGGVYEDETWERGGTNAEDLMHVLQDLLPNTLWPVGLSSGWEGEAAVLAMHPRLVLIHRSSFFHSLNAEINVGAPSETNQAWQALYRAGDNQVKQLIGLIGTVEPEAKFLVYSRGTDARWLKESYRKEWVSGLENRFPALKGHVSTMVIPNENGGASRGAKGGTFKDPKTAHLMREEVKRLLDLKDNR